MSRTTSTPAIRVPDTGSHHGRLSIPQCVSDSAVPMAIPNAREPPPPPLPPPRHISELSLQYNNDPQWRKERPYPEQGRGPFAPPKSSSGLISRRRGGGSSSNNDAVLSFKSRNQRSKNSRSDVVEDETINSGNIAGSNYGLQSENQLGQRSLEDSSQAYDKQLLSKIGGPNTPNRSTHPGFRAKGPQDSLLSSACAVSSTDRQQSLPNPQRRHGSLDSASCWSTSSGTSLAQSSLQSPTSDLKITGTGSNRRYGSLSVTEDSSVGSRTFEDGSEQGMPMDPEFVDERAMRDLNINDRSPGPEEHQNTSTGALKRRASSPPVEAFREDRPIASNRSDSYHPRSALALGNRNSPFSKFHINQGSLSSSISSGHRINSYNSSYLSSVASSATSYSSDRPQTSSFTLNNDGDVGRIPSYAVSNSIKPSPKGTILQPHKRLYTSGESPAHNRTSSTDIQMHSRQNSKDLLRGQHVCDCCPKKPKKFDTEDELRVHELEKQYKCQFCPNRFKNKNEAERHKNSLHLRRHSWSCAALAGVHAAFQPSTSHPTGADICGYCGEEFSNPPDWDSRSEHLKNVHKYSECNQTKKFFRADHFRQHLKHSHAGSSGKWTNMLENACMKDEPPLEERLSSSSVCTGSLTSQSAPGMINEDLAEL